jgi:nucleoside-diphosphate-sugar epimerase
MNIEGNGLSGMLGAEFASFLAKQHGIHAQEKLLPSENCDVFFHFAARFPPSCHDEIFNSNILLLKNVLKIIKPHTRLVFISSNSVYERNTGEINEETSVDPQSYYARSKLTGERLIRLSHRNHLILRFPAILGLKKSYNLFTRIIDTGLKENKVKLFNAGNIYNNYITVEKGVNILANLFARKGVLGTFCLGAVPNKSLLEIAQLLLRDLDRDILIANELKRNSGIKVNTSKLEKEINLSLDITQSELSEWGKDYVKLLRVSSLIV